MEDIKEKLDDEMLEEVCGGMSKWRPNVKTATVTSSTDDAGVNINTNSES